MLASAGRTSSQRRVLRPQSGFTQSRSTGTTFKAAFKRPTISDVSGTRGEWMSKIPGPISLGYSKSVKAPRSSIRERDASIEITSASKAAIDSMMSLNSA